MTGLAFPKVQSLQTDAGRVTNTIRGPMARRHTVTSSGQV